MCWVNPDAFICVLAGSFATHLYVCIILDLPSIATHGNPSLKKSVADINIFCHGTLNTRTVAIWLIISSNAS